MGFNPQNKVLKDKRIREAISKAIDTNDLSPNKKLKGLFQSDVPYVNSSNQHNHTYAPSDSEKLLKEAGYKKNSNGYFEKDGKVLSLKLALQTHEFPEWKTKAEIMQQALKKVGIKLDINILDSQTYYETLTVRKDFDLIYYRTYTNALMPYNFLNARFKQADHQPGAFADDSKLTEMIKQFPTIIDKQQRQSAFDKLSNYIDNQYLAVPISYPNETFVTTPKISNFEFSGQTDAPINFDKLKVKNNE